MNRCVFPIHLSHKIQNRLTEDEKKNAYEWIRPSDNNVKSKAYFCVHVRAKEAQKSAWNAKGNSTLEPIYFRIFAFHCANFVLISCNWACVCAVGYEVPFLSLSLSLSLATNRPKCNSHQSYGWVPLEFHCAEHINHQIAWLYFKRRATGAQRTLTVIRIRPITGYVSEWPIKATRSAIIAAR